MQKPLDNPSKFLHKEREWERLLSQVARGSESALNTLYQDTSHLVYGIAFRILGDVLEAEEITVDVYMQVWKNAGRYDSKLGAPSAWLLMLARSRAIDRMRSRAQKKRFEELSNTDTETAASNPEETVMISERRKVIESALSKLSPLQRKSVELAYFYGFSQSEIASQMGHPLGTIKSWLRFGMIRLREILTSFERE